MNKRNKSLIALLLVLCVGLVGLTIAYFVNSTSIENTFTTKEYGTTYEETFVSPDNWLPGDTTEKTLVATNTGEVDQAVRVLVTESWTTDNDGTLNGWIHSDGTKSTHTTQSELETDERVAILNLANTSDWTKVGNYYYYNYKLAPTESTSSLLESVTFNPKTKLDDTCTETVNNGTRTITCNSTGSDYDHATYTLTFTVETVQYDKYAEAWQLPNNTTIAIGGSKPQAVNFAQAIMSKSNAASITNYTDGVTTEAYTFNHDATEQTPALTDYRYIGASPNNYVEFNCDDNGNNCEIWRAIGVFYVDDGNNNWEWRVKLVRGNYLSDKMAWDSNQINDWTNASLKNTLNGIYLNSLSSSAKLMIEDAKYYLGGYSQALPDHGGPATFGTADDIYNWERGNDLCGSCGEDMSKLAWIGKVAIMYPSDQFMVYANSVHNNCYNNPLYCVDSEYGWISYSDDNMVVVDDSYFYYDRWLLSTFTTYTSGAFRDDGGTLFDCHDYNVSYEYAIRPVLYLSSSVKTTSGDGSIDSPYKLSL